MANSHAPLEIAIAAGGTAGHINPALALAEELRERGHHVRFFGQPNKLEGTLVPEAGFELVPIHVSGFNRRKPWTLISAGIQMEKAKAGLQRLFAQEGAPDVAVGFGAYVELPLMRWCAAHKVPYVLHEQNSVTGLANQVSARAATRVCVAFPQAKSAFLEHVSDPDRIVVTGNPVRRSVLSAQRGPSRHALGVHDDEVFLLIFGGSLGARSLNNAVIGLKEQLLSCPDVRILQSCGAELYDEVVDALKLSEKEKRRWEVRPYISNMGEALAAADCIVSRSGASSVAEIAARALPSILVPFPLATADHQTTNAHLLSDVGAAVLVPDGEVATESFSTPLLKMVEDADMRFKMHNAAQGLDQGRSAQLLADQVELSAQARSV